MDEVAVVLVLMRAVCGVIDGETDNGEKDEPEQRHDREGNGFVAVPSSQRRRFGQRRAVSPHSGRGRSPTATTLEEACPRRSAPARRTGAAASAGQ